LVEATKIMIGIPTAGYIRHAGFMDYFNQLEKPEGCMVSFSHGASPARARNQMIEAALEHDCTHVFFLDDDMAPAPDLIYRLLAHKEDIVTGLYLMRNYPHLPVAFDAVFPDGKNKHMFLTNEVQGLVEVTNCGLGAVLIKTGVFKIMQKPWVTLGELERDGWCDDISFFNRARQTGFKIFCDTDARVGHLTQSIVFPHFHDNKWVTAFNTGALEAIQVPQLIPEV
jgi:hypothetical protein